MKLNIIFRYQVCIRTGNSIGAGTNSEVLIQIFGDHGEKTNYWKLGYSETNKTPFKRGQADVFTIGDRYSNVQFKLQSFSETLATRQR